MTNNFARTFKVLTASAIALASVAAQASNNAGSVSIIDMTTDSTVSSDFIITTGFLHELDLVAFEEPATSLAADVPVFDTESEAPKSGWAGLVEVDMSDEATLPMDELSSFSDSFDTTDREKKMSGFYTMRYAFNSDMPFRPYAGAGLGLVATSNDTQTSGVFAGRATAGFDMTVGNNAAIFAEYAFVKSGGLNIGTANTTAASAIPNTEHSLKLGFRRTF